MLLVLLVLTALNAVLAHRASLLMLLLSLELASAALYSAIALCSVLLSIDASSLVLSLVILTSGASEVALGISLVLLIARSKPSAALGAHLLLLA